MVKPMPCRFGPQRQRRERGQQLAQHAVALRLLVARMERRELHRDARRGGDVAAGRRRADGGDGGVRSARNSAARRPRCAPPRPACRRNGGSRGAPAALARSSASSMVRPMTNWRARMRIAAVTAWRITGSPERATQPAQRRAEIAARRRSLDEPAGQHQRPGRGIDEQRVRMAEMARPVGRRRSCRGSAGRPWRRRGCAAAPRRGTSARRPPASRARIRAGRRRCRPCRAAGGAPRRRGRCARSAMRAARIGRQHRGGEDALDRLRLVLAIDGAQPGAAGIGGRRRRGKDETHRAFRKLGDLLDWGLQDHDGRGIIYEGSFAFWRSIRSLAIILEPKRRRQERPNGRLRHMKTTTVSRRKFIKRAALATTAAIAAPYMRTSYSAGRLNLGCWDHWVPGANDTLTKICNEWGEQEPRRGAYRLHHLGRRQGPAHGERRGPGAYRPRHHAASRLADRGPSRSAGADRRCHRRPDQGSRADL